MEILVWMGGLIDDLNDELLDCMDNGNGMAVMMTLSGLWFGVLRYPFVMTRSERRVI